MTSPVPPETLVRVLGLLAAAKLAQFRGLAHVSDLAPDVASRVGMASRAAVQMTRVQAISEMLRELGADPMEAIAEHIGAIDGFEGSSIPSDWWEGLLKGYVGQGVMGDLERELVSRLDANWRDRLLPVMATGRSRVVVEHIVADTAASDERWEARLSLWGRRVVGEALSVVQKMLLADPDVGRLILGAEPTSDAVSALRGRLTAEHARRMTALGLTA